MSWTTSFPESTPRNYVSHDGIEFESEVALDQIDADSIGGGTVDQAGTYHFVIEDAELRSEPGERDNLEYWRPSVNLRLRVLQSVAGQSPAGAVMWHELRVPLPVDKSTMTKGKNPRPRAESMTEANIAFLMGIGYLEKREGKLVRTDNGVSGFNYREIQAHLKGRQFIGRVKHRQDTRKSDGAPMHFYEFPFGNGCSQVDDIQNANVPMNEDALKQVGKAHPRHKLPSSAPAVKSAPTVSGNGPAAVSPAATTGGQVASQPGGVSLGEL